METKKFSKFRRNFAEIVNLYHYHQKGLRASGFRKTGSGANQKKEPSSMLMGGGIPGFWAGKAGTATAVIGGRGGGFLRPAGRPFRFPCCFRGDLPPAPGCLLACGTGTTVIMLFTAVDAPLLLCVTCSLCWCWRLLLE